LGENFWEKRSKLFQSNFYGKNNLCLSHKELEFDGFSGKGRFYSNSSLKDSRGEE
jgi:hypothetical protein